MNEYVEWTNGSRVTYDKCPTVSPGVLRSEVGEDRATGQASGVACALHNYREQLLGLTQTVSQSCVGCIIFCRIM